MQTSLPPFANTAREGWSRIVAAEGYAGLYKGLVPLWGRQIPYTMVKFATFETTVAYIYSSFGKPKESFSKLQQTGVSFLGGYIAGIGCAAISHPADVMVSKLNADRKGTVYTYYIFPLSNLQSPSSLTQTNHASQRICHESHVSHLQQHRLRRAVERSTSAYLHDWNIDREFAFLSFWIYVSSTISPYRSC